MRGVTNLQRTYQNCRLQSVPDIKIKSDGTSSAIRSARTHYSLMGMTGPSGTTVTGRGSAWGRNTSVECVGMCVVRKYLEPKAYAHSPKLCSRIRHEGSEPWGAARRNAECTRGMGANAPCYRSPKASPIRQRGEGPLDSAPVEMPQS